MNIEDLLFEELVRKNYKVSTAESCTGGLLAGTIINVSGASKIIDMGVVTYSNEAKINLIGVDENTLISYGAVSEEVAIQMAKGIALKSGSNIGLSTSGIAGPTGGSDKKPVGMVCFGIYANGKEFAFTHIFENLSRKLIRESSVEFILNKLYELIKDDYI
ncbi:MAG: CinA family protein [Clostridia bacterium]|nr:CinA family protein [Clostridia bacterium]